jgi:transcriptional regulator of arginine metabolism
VSDRHRRQRRIAELLSGHGPDVEEPVQSQEQLRDLLAESGIDVTQGTLSRDLRSLGVVKGPAGYILPGGLTGLGAAPRSERSPPAVRLTLTRELEAAVREHLVAAETAGTVVVLRTPPAHAAAIADAIDRFPPKGVVGTVAGDDTTFVAVKSPAVATRLARYFRSLAGIA